MNLYWLVFQTSKGPVVYLEEGTGLISARLKAAIANVEGEYTEGHELDAKTAKKIPKKLIRRPLSRAEAVKLLQRLG